jgi:hypothetical protein
LTKSLTLRGHGAGWREEGRERSNHE